MKNLFKRYEDFADENKNVDKYVSISICLFVIILISSVEYTRYKYECDCLKAKVMMQVGICR